MDDEKNPLFCSKESFGEGPRTTQIIDMSSHAGYDSVNDLSNYFSTYDGIT